MPKMPAQAYTIADLTKWVQIARTEAPESPSQEACEAAPKVRSFTTMGHPTGVILVLKLDNGETISLHANPVIAQHLGLNILATGQQMKWLNQNNEIIP